MVKKMLNIGYNASLLFLLMFANVLVLTSVLYFVKIPISVFHLPISLIIAVIELFLIRKESIKNILFSALLFILVFACGIGISGHIYDVSYDGNSYHKEAVGALESGWNPIYDDAESFSKDNDINIQFFTWLDHYPKTTWIYGANVYKLTGNIETAKSFNFLILFVVFFIIAYLINKFYDKKIVAILMAFSVCLFPIIWQQIFSLYLDGFMGFILFLTIIYMYLIIKNDKEKEYFAVIGALLIILINTKFTGLFYGGLFCLGYFVYYATMKIKNKDYNSLFKTTGIFVFIVLVSLLVVGSNSYIKNTITNGNPLYPLIGKDKIDIMSYLQPASFAEMSPIEKQYYSLFSHTANIGVFNNGEPELKIPFTKNSWEITQFGEDTRIGGFGIYFSGILIISLMILLIYFGNCIYHRNYENLIFLGIPFIIIIFIMFVLGEGWWARYSPQIYFIPLMAIYLLIINRVPCLKLIGFILIIIAFSNSYDIANRMTVTKIPASGISRMNLEKMNGKEINIEMVNSNFTGTLFNLRDYNINYTITDKLENKKDLYVGKIYYEERK